MVTNLDEAKEAILEHIKVCPTCNELVKRVEDHEIAENLEDYWRHLQSGAEQC